VAATEKRFKMKTRYLLLSERRSHKVDAPDQRKDHLKSHQMTFVAQDYVVEGHLTDFDIQTILEYLKEA
jgi:hypothetical protein